MKQTTNKKILLAIIISSIFSLSSLIFVMATPSGPRFDYASSSTSSALTGTARTDDRGTITTLILNTSQVNTKWKAYVGNVTGKLLLQDANNFTIYEWTVAAYTGEVYASRNSSISWLDIGCANSTTITTEDTSLNLQSNTQNSINGTFNEINHTSFVVGTSTVPKNTCQATYTFNSSGQQAASELASFQEILLQDNSTKKLVYVTPMESEEIGYDNTAYDFQMLVADDDSQATAQTYYFFVELN